MLDLASFVVFEAVSKNYQVEMFNDRLCVKVNDELYIAKDSFPDPRKVLAYRIVRKWANWLKPTIKMSVNTNIWACYSEPMDGVYFLIHYEDDKGVKLNF